MYVSQNQTTIISAPKQNRFAYHELGRLAKDPLVVHQLLPQLAQAGEPAVIGTHQGKPPLLRDGRRSAVHAERGSPEFGRNDSHSDSDSELG